MSEGRWGMCKKKNCLYKVTWDSGVYCYRHSRWYRFFLVPFNHTLRILEDNKELILFLFIVLIFFASGCYVMGWVIDYFMNDWVKPGQMSIFGGDI